METHTPVSEPEMPVGKMVTHTPASEPEMPVAKKPRINMNSQHEVESNALLECFQRLQQRVNDDSFSTESFCTSWMCLM